MTIKAELINIVTGRPLARIHIMNLALTPQYIYETLSGEIEIYTEAQANATIEGWQSVSASDPKKFVVKMY